MVDCKTVVFFANATDGVGPSSNERSGASVKTAREKTNFIITKQEVVSMVLY